MNIKILKSIITVLLIFMTIISYGQDNRKYSISGQVIDSTSNQPIEYASIAAYKLPDTVLVTGTVTDVKGKFILNKLKSGKYILKFNFIGYKANSKIVEIKNASINFSLPFYMTSSSLNLDEVEITATQNEKKKTIEKTKINVSKNISSVSGNITDVLKSQSGINIDGDNTVYLRGNKNILILMDGIPTTISAINSIPTSNVQNIEIITNPDVKYDAEGTGGIINIITKGKSGSGLSGSTTLNYGFYNRINGGLNLNYRKGIWGLSFNYNGKYEKTDIASNLTRQLYGQNILIKQDINSIRTNPAHLASMRISAKPNKKETIVFDVKTSYAKFDKEQHILGREINNNSSVEFNRINEIPYIKKVFESSLTYKKVYEKHKNELSFKASYSHRKGHRPSNYYIDNILSQKSEAGGGPTWLTFQADYLKSVTKTGKIETGIKGFSRKNAFSMDFYDLDNSNNWILNPSFSNAIEHQEYIYSSYLMYSDKTSKKTFFKLGARVEYNTSELNQTSTNERVYNEYLFPFPFLVVKHKINENQKIALSINRRITRPTYPQLFPILYVIDQLTFEIGNKKLKPEVLDKVEMNYSFIKNKFHFNTSIYASSTKDFITQVSSLSSNNSSLVLTYVNGKRQNKIGGDFDLRYKFNKYISINSSFSVFQTNSTGQYNGIDLSTNNLAYTENFKTIIKPDQKTELQILLNYNSPIDLPQFNLSEIYYADIALKRKFFKNKFSVSLTLTDVFNTQDWKIQTDNVIYKLDNYSKSETRLLWLGLKYNFNSYKSKKPRKKGSKNNKGGIIKLG